MLFVSSLIVHLELILVDCLSLCIESKSIGKYQWFSMFFNRVNNGMASSRKSEDIVLRYTTYAREKIRCECILVCHTPSVLFLFCYIQRIIFDEVHRFYLLCTGLIDLLWSDAGLRLLYAFSMTVGCTYGFDVIAYFCGT